MATSKTYVFDPQDRDVNLLLGLFESRIMTAGHIATLYFDDSREAAKKRLQKLKAEGLIGERRRRVYEPAVLFLTRKAHALLSQKGKLQSYPALDPASLDKRSRVSELTLRHELEIMDVRAAFHSAFKKVKPFSLTEFSTWPLLYQFEAIRNGRRGAEVLVKPDGYIRIHEPEVGTKGYFHDFFLEVDRSHEVQDKLVEKASGYFDYFKSGGFAVRCGGTLVEYKEYPFRVLMVFKTAERRNNTAERLLQNNPPIFTQVCLSTFEEVTSDPLGAIWITPRDYREATKGTPFGSEVRQKTWVYRRQTRRESLVEESIQKFALLNS